ncbi:hypothetical protein ACN28S_05065 [Cystobacter fuscus]
MRAWVHGLGAGVTKASAFANTLRRAGASKPVWRRDTPAPARVTVGVGRAVGVATVRAVSRTWAVCPDTEGGCF